ncbi:uncharacterized protein LOC125238902 [Leguminivora glycinivorella]|uniref:uncharacterized protein LOC125238902 n=1 Tax=Leguminivora glycinivorella TaxID=1035111 RepID=UPI00200DB300|nr:uncharacterized protein LOC125238902 [Leguminivora glycinivorella]
MSKLSFRARALDASKPMPIYLAEELPDLPDYSAINRAVPQMPSGMEKEEECEHHLQRAICTGLIIPTPEVCDVQDLEFYEQCYPPDYKMPKQHIHMQPLWQEQEAPEYDIDSEDERWLKQQRHPELTELMFEQMMDKLEKSSGQTVVTLNEAKLLLERHDDLVIAVYDYWLNKRLKTQHPLILSVKTESRPGQSSNNPYLAFRRRTEKMQTRKNRKNDESSYEKMLKLRRELARALSLLEMVARREKAKRELLRLTAAIAERRYHAGDFTEPQPRVVGHSTSVALPLRSRVEFPPHYAPRAPPTPVDTQRQREKRPYKRRKHRHHAPAAVAAHREPAFASSSEEEPARPDAAPPDDGPFAFRRKPGCFYEMPTSTLCGDPVDPDNKDGLYEHELDERHRFNLTSLSEPYRRCVGFARLRRGRGGRLALDRLRHPLDDLWSQLPPPPHHTELAEEVDLETKVHRTPKEITRDYHATNKYPWRHAFRKHLRRNPHLWLDLKPDVTDLKPEVIDLKPEVIDLKDEVDAGLKCRVEELKSDISVRTIDSEVRKRAWSSSEDSDGSLQPVEQEFERFIDEVNKKWLHFRPKTPPLSPPYLPPADEVPVEPDTPLCVELREQGAPTFTTDQFTLADLMPALGDLTDLGLSEDLGGSLPSESELKLADNRQPASDPFLCVGRGPGARGPALGCSAVRVTHDAQPIYMDRPVPVPVPSPLPPAKKEPAPPAPTPAPPTPAPAPVPASRLIVEEVNEVPQIKLEKKKKDDTIEEIQLAHGVQLKTVQTKHSPLKKHIITSAHRRTEHEPQIRTQVTDTLKVRLQNHLLSSQASVVSSGATVVGLVQNGPFTAVPSQPGVATSAVAVSVPGAGTSSPRRAAPLLPLGAGRGGLLAAPVVVGTVGAVGAQNKLKVLHAHPLTHEQRAQLLQARAHGITPLPAVVSLATLEAKSSNTAAILKAAPGSVAQFFEIKGGQLGKGPHLVNVVRQPPPKPTHVTDKKPRQVVAAIDHQALKGGVAAAAAARGRVSLSLDGRQLVRAALPGVRGAAPQLLRHQIQLKHRRDHQPTISIAAPTKTASIPSSVVANLLQKNVSLGAPRLSLPQTAGVQALAFSAAQLKARQARLVPARPVPRP